MPPAKKDTSDTSELQRLLTENEALQRKLDVCVRWMKRQIEESVSSISQRRLRDMTKSSKDTFVRENQADIITKKIQEYFGDLLLLNAPSKTIEYLVNSEINFYNLYQNPTLDGLSVVSSYHKILDAFIEHAVTKNFRKFAKKRNCVVLLENDPIEKALHFVVNKDYIISIGRFFGLLKAIRQHESQGAYGTTFSLYIERNQELATLLLGDTFYNLFDRLVRSEVFGEKRHRGSITFDETKLVREWMVGDFQNKSSVLYILLQSESVMY